MNLERLRAFKSTESQESERHQIFVTVDSLDKIVSSRRGEITVEIEAALDLDFYLSDKEKEERHILSAGDKTYVISPITSESIFSSHYMNCQGIVVSGTTHEGKIVGFQTHHDPSIFADKKTGEAFIFDLRGRLRELRSVCREETIDVVLFGGDAYAIGEGAGSFIDSKLTRADDYRIAAETVSEITQGEIGLSPRIVEGPRINPYQDGETVNRQDGLFITRHRHLHIIVAGASENTGEAFGVQDLPEVLDKLRVIEKRVRDDRKDRH